MSCRALSHHYTTLYIHLQVVNSVSSLRMTGSLYWTSKQTRGLTAQNLLSVVCATRLTGADQDSIWAFLWFLWNFCWLLNFMSVVAIYRCWSFAVCCLPYTPSLHYIVLLPSTLPQRLRLPVPPASQTITTTETTRAAQCQLAAMSKPLIVTLRHE